MHRLQNLWSSPPPASCTIWNVVILIFLKIFHLIVGSPVTSVGYWHSDKYGFCFIFLVQMLYSWFQSAHVNHWVPSGEGMHTLWSRLSWFTCYLLTILYHCFFWKWKLLSCVLLCDPKNCKPTSLLCPWTSPGQNTGVCCHSLLQGIFQTQGSKSGLLLCRQILYSLSHQGSLF